ncbi:MAG: flavodoxin [Clostridia bacterium]|nr:flavodoxin [Clostridia bacterium]
MNIAIIYYSQSGNADFVANELAKQLEADIVRIEPEKAYPDKGFKKFFWGGKSAVMGETPKLVPYEFDAQKYDVVILGYPVWAGTFAPPIRTFAEQNRVALAEKTVLAFATSSGGNAEKSFVKLASLLKKDKIFPTLSIVDPLVKPSDDKLAQIEAFCEQIKELELNA